MTDFDNTNRGILSRNDRKAKETHPDFTGSLNVEGVEYFLDGWVRQRKDGTGKFFSLSLKRKEKQQSAPPAVQRPAPPPARGGSGFDDMDSDIPF